MQIHESKPINQSTVLLSSKTGTFAHTSTSYQSGKFTKALKKFESILASILERFGDSHHRVGAALHNVGIANLRAGKLDDAMDAIEEAVRIRKATLGPQDPKVAVSTFCRVVMDATR